MFTKHFKKQLSAYAHGELPAEEAERVATHLRACAACRAEFEEIRLGVRLAECLPQVKAPENLWDGIEAALVKDSANARQRPSQIQTRELTHLRPTRLQRARMLLFPSVRSLFSAHRRAFAAACAVAVVAVVAGLAWFYIRASRPSWDVARIEGAPRIASDSIGERGRLGVGQWLETDAASRAEIAVANIGEVEGEPDTRVRLVQTKMAEHRL